MIGTFKCVGCGKNIRKIESLEKHLKTKSHHQSLEWLEYHRPKKLIFLN
jgi:hypothetical protein